MNMRPRAGAELRTFPRRPLGGGSAAVMRLAESGRPLSYHGVDISKRGIGIMTKDIVIPETEVLFEVDGKSVLLELVWSRTLLPGSPFKRYGFKVVDDSVDLESIVDVDAYQG